MRKRYYKSVCQKRPGKSFGTGKFAPEKGLTSSQFDRKIEENDSDFLGFENLLGERAFMAEECLKTSKPLGKKYRNRLSPAFKGMVSENMDAVFFQLTNES